MQFRFTPKGNYINIMRPQNAEEQESLFNQDRFAECRVAHLVFAASSSIVKLCIGNWSCAECSRVGGFITGPVRRRYEERI